MSLLTTCVWSVFKYFWNMILAAASCWRTGLVWAVQVVWASSSHLLASVVSREGREGELCWPRSPFTPRWNERAGQMLGTEPLCGCCGRLWYSSWPANVWLLKQLLILRKALTCSEAKLEVCGTTQWEVVWSDPLHRLGATLNLDPVRFWLVHRVGYRGLKQNES